MRIATFNYSKGVCQSAILILTVALFYSSRLDAQDKVFKNVLYLNFYAVTYSWGDSVTKGIVNTFIQRPDINLYVEYLDCKRFGNVNFNSQYNFLQKKYESISLDIVVVSDNDALDFFMLYGDSLASNIPVIFCGINNPEDYNFDNSRYYGIKEGVDQDSVNHLILRIIPDVKNLYFFYDSTTTSLVNFKYVKSLESKYKKRVKFKYITNLSVDSILKVVPTFKEGDAIALIDIFQDINKKPVNSDVVVQKIAEISTVPIFIDSQTSFGKGILGGIFNKGADHGREAALLALKFIDIQGFKPIHRIAQPVDHYYFDFNILTKYHIDENLLPVGSVIINKPPSAIMEYLKYIIILTFFAGFLMLIIFYLIININRRRKAEQTINQKLIEINDKNARLEEINKVVNNLNSELEELNENLSKANAALLDAKQKAEEADKLKTSFLANMSHEIRTPLNAIVGFSNLSADPSLPPENRSYFAQIIKLNSDQLLNLIDDILDFSKIEANQLFVSNSLFSVQEIYFELFASANQYNLKKGIEIRLADFVIENHLMIDSDQTRVKQILTNLVSNALKFTSEGFIELGYYINEKDTVVLYVKDTGMGIEPQFIDHIFDRFWKYEGDDNKLYSGTGLGLAICKRLSEMLGGKIWVESEYMKGTTFYFSIPRFFYIKKESEDELKKAEDADNHMFDWQDFTVAIAEDEEYNLQFLIETLKQTRINILEFRNGVEITEYFKKEKKAAKVDIILMDIKMPKKDGYIALTEIRKMYPKIPVIAQTAYAMVSDIKRIKDAGFDDYITKPLKFALLLEKLNYFLEKER